MIASSSRAFWQQISAAGVLAVLASCSGGSALPEPIEENDPGAIAGELAIYVATLEDGTNETHYMLRDQAGEEQRLVFEREPEVDPGTKIHVWGNRTGDAISVTSFKRAFRDLPGLGTATEALAMPTPRPPRNVCSVLVAINNPMTIPDAIGVGKIDEQFHVGPTSVNAYYQENSYGKDSIGGKTYGPMPYTTTSGCDYNGLTRALRPMITEPCAQYSWVMYPRQMCSWAGLASVGTPTAPARDTWYNASIGCVVTVQEPGHNYGMNHSSSMSCGMNAIPFFADDLMGCTHSEYGDRFDPMGGGCRHMNVWQKQYEQWFGGCNAIKVSASGTFNLLPAELACDGVQSIQLTFPGGKTRSFNRPAGGGGGAGVDILTSYYLEYRTSVGFDKGMTPQVLVHTGTNPVTMTGQRQGAPHTWILNASQKGLNTQPGLLAGGSFSDPAGGLTVTVQSLDADKAVIQVEYAAGATNGPACLDNTVLSGSGPAACNGTVVTTDAGPNPAGTGGTTGTPRDAGRDTGLAGAGGRPPEGGVGSGQGGSVVGTGGAIGEAGAAGTGNGTGGDTPGVGGGAGVSIVTTTGTAGTSPKETTTGPGLSQGPSDLAGGCACRVGAQAPATNDKGLGALAMLGLAGLFGSRRRSRQR